MKNVIQMKKYISLIALLTIVLVSSCKKNHVCSCVKTSNTNGIIGEYPVVDSVFNDMTTSDAQELCNKGDHQSSLGVVTTTINCELK